MSSKKTKSTELALVDQSVPSTLELLANELKALKGITESNYRTSGNLDGIGDIKTIKEIPALIRAYGSVISREQIYNMAAEDLGLASYPTFAVGGGNVADWKHDIDLRIKIITHEDRKKELESLMSEMKSYLSQEDQKAITLAKIAKALGK